MRRMNQMNNDSPLMLDVIRGRGGIAAGYFTPTNEESQVDTGTATLVSVVSRKHHANGDFDITLDTSAAIDGLVTVEPRINSVPHQIVFTFSRSINSVGVISAVDSTGANFGRVTAAVSGNTVVVAIAGASDKKRVTVSISEINGTTVSASVNMGFLIGDLNSSRTVTGTDVNSFPARNGFIASTTLSSGFPLFTWDLNLSGVIEGSAGMVDLLLCQNNSGSSI